VFQNNWVKQVVLIRVDGIEIVSVWIKRTPEGTSRLFGFVLFTNESDAQAAVAKMNDKV
jgi:hypothetical protein